MPSKEKDNCQLDIKKSNELGFGVKTWGFCKWIFCFQSLQLSVIDVKFQLPLYMIRSHNIAAAEQM